MFKLIPCLLLAAVVQLHAFDTGDDVDSNGGVRMIGGDIVEDATTFSFQVAIQPMRMQRGEQVELPVCSGILIRGDDAIGGFNYYVLTSGHCAMSGTTFRLWVGTNRVSPGTQPDAEASVDNAIINERYLRTFTNGDLAIISAPLEIKDLVEGTNPISTKLVTVATLPKVDDVGKSYFASSVTMAGWGYPNDVFFGPSPSLRQLNSRVVGNVYCQLRHPGKTVTKEHICTGGLINKGPCTGDSGAPLIVSQSDSVPRVIALATFTPENGCSRGKPGVFTRLGSYLDWISLITNYDVEQ